MTKDLTQGKPFKVLLMFALPMIISVTFQQFYNICDSIIAGRFIGDSALSAINASYPMVNIYLGFATGCGVGAGVICSKFFGQKDNKNLKTAISTAFISIITLALFLTLIGIIFNEAFIRMLKTPNDIFVEASNYLMLYVTGLVFTFIYNLCGYIFQSLGNSKTPLYFLIFSSLLNIILDFIFIFFIKKSVSSLAVATIISQAISSILALVFLLRQLKKVESNYNIFDFSILKKIMIIAVPSIIQSSIISIGQLFVQSLINSYGSNVIAAYGSAFKINMLFVNIFTTISNAISNFTAQNLGANKLERIKEGLKSGLIINLIVVIMGVTICNVFSSDLIKLFLNKESNIDIINVGKGFLNIVTPFFLFVAVKISFDGVLKGSGDMKPFMVSTMADLILRVGFAYLLSWKLGSYIGIWWSWPIGWLVGCALSVLFYFIRHNVKSCKL